LAFKGNTQLAVGGNGAIWSRQYNCARNLSEVDVGMAVKYLLASKLIEAIKGKRKHAK